MKARWTLLAFLLAGCAEGAPPLNVYWPWESKAFVPVVVVVSLFVGLIWAMLAEDAQPQSPKEYITKNIIPLLFLWMIAILLLTYLWAVFLFLFVFVVLVVGLLYIMRLLMEPVAKRFHVAGKRLKNFLRKE
jgi:cobalamin synthase